MPKRYITLLLLTTIFVACKRKFNPNGVYHIYKAINGKHSDQEADDALKKKYLNQPFSIAFNAKGAVRISDPADFKTMVLHRVNEGDGAVWYTTAGYFPLYRDTSIADIRLRITSSDTVLFIPDKFFLSLKSVSGKTGGMIICRLTKTEK